MGKGDPLKNVKKILLKEAPSPIKMSQALISTDELSDELEKILDKSFNDIRKRITTLIIRREKRLLKQAKTALKTSRAPIGRKLKKNKRRYHSSSEDSGSSSE